MTLKLVSILLVCAACAMEFEASSHQEALKRLNKIKDDISVDLTDENFEHLTQAATGATTGDWLVYFYDPSCVNCSYFNPTYRMLAKMVRDEQIGVNIAKIDASKNLETTARFRVESFPTVLYFHQGKYYNYTGPRDESDMLEMIKEGTYTQYTRKRVPEPRTLFTKAMKFARWLVFRVPKQYPMYFAGGILGLVALMVAVCYTTAKEENRQTVQPEQAKKNQ
jgi:thiol-disulfide isomerase/thioredoxin